MELKDIESNAAAHARGDSPNLGTRTIAAWIARIAKALLEHAGSVQAHGLFEVRNAIRADATTSAEKLGQMEARVNHAIASLTKPQIIEQGSHTMTLGHIEGSPGMAVPQVFDPVTDRERQEQHRRISRLIARATAVEQQHKVTQAQLDKFMSACADQTLQIAELRAEVNVRKQQFSSVTALEAKCQRLEAQNHAFAQRESTVSPEENRLKFSIDGYVSQLARLRDVVLNGRTMTVEALITEAIDEIHTPCPDCADMAKQLEDRGEQLAVADGDRVPLAMDLENAQAELKEAKEFAGRMQPVIKAAVKTQGLWIGSDLTKPVASPLIAALCEQSEALKEYETACAQAANAEDDIAF